VSFEQFDYATLNLLKSLSDGKDLRDSAAEYIIAWESLDNSPNGDATHTLLKSAAEYILKEEEDITVASEDPELSWDKYIYPGKVPLVAFDASAPLSRHAWLDGLMAAENPAHGRAHWPTYHPPSARHAYQHFNFPFHEFNHPLLRVSPGTGEPTFVNVLRRFYLGGHAQKEKDMEIAFLNHLREKNSPLLNDFIPYKREKNDGYAKQFKLLGDLTHGTSPNAQHAVDLYERDFTRWLANNFDAEQYWITHQAEMADRGYSSVEEALRHQHFDDRKRGWLEEDVDQEHPTKLGHTDYMYGLEWLTPEERHVVMEALNQPGGINGSKNHYAIQLPDGTLFPTSRIAWNAVLRMTPEMDWATRKPRHSGRGNYLMLEDNDRDYGQGDEGKFLQHGLGNATRVPLESLSESFTEDGTPIPMSFHDKVLSMLYEAHGVDEILNEIDETSSKATAAKKKSKWELSLLPKFDFKNNPEVLDSTMTWDDIKEASRSHFKKGKQEELLRTRFDFDNLLFLAGYDPRTRTVMANHPMYGVQNPNEPTINLSVLEEMAEEAQGLESLERSAKDINNDMAYLKAAVGPHPSEDNLPDIWQISDDGAYTYGPGRFWDMPFAPYGGQNMSLNTYHDIIHSPHSDEEGNSHMFKGVALNGQDSTEATGNGFLMYHFMTPQTVTEGVYDETKRNFQYLPKSFPIRNMLSPANVTRLHTQGHDDGNFKHNYTLFAHSFSPEYEYFQGRITKKEADAMKDKVQTQGMNLEHMSSTLSHNQFSKTGGKENYAASGSGISMVIDALRHAMYLGLDAHHTQPRAKSVSSYTDVMRGLVPFPAGETLNDFLSMMGWEGSAKKPTFESMKDMFLDVKADRQGLSTVRDIAQMLNTTNPADVERYLREGDDGDFTQLMNYLNERYQREYSQQEVINQVNHALNDVPYYSKVAAKNKKGTAQGIKEDAPRRGIAHMMKVGGALPAMQEEQDLQNEMMGILEQIESDPNLDVESIRQRYQEVKERLVELQLEAQKGALGEVNSDWWKAHEDHAMKEMDESRKLVTFVAANVLKPLWEEQDPSAFDAADPAKAHANMLRLFHDAERWILSHPAQVTGLTRQAYGFRTEVKDMKSKDSDVLHDIRDYLTESGLEVHGNENPEDVLGHLGIEITPYTKEYAASLIQEAQNRGYPLHVNNVGNLLTSGVVQNIGNYDTSFLHPRDEEFMQQNIHDLDGEDEINHTIHTHGYSKGVEKLQQAKYQGKSNLSAWKAHGIHRAAGAIVQRMRPNQFSDSLELLGLQLHQGDPHGKAEGSKNTFTWQNINTRNKADTLIVYDPMQDQSPPREETMSNTSTTRGWHAGMPVGGSHPTQYPIMPTFNTGMNVHFSGSPVTSSGGFDFMEDGTPVYGNNPVPFLPIPVPTNNQEEVMGKEWVRSVQPNLPPPMDTSFPFSRLTEDGLDVVSNDPYIINASETTAFINNLLEGNDLIAKSDEPEWIAPIRPMHRIFELTDLQHLRGFSNSWAVSKWYDGKRVIIIKNGDEITVLDENNRKVNVKKKFREALEQLNDRNYTLDGILGDEELNIVDIVNYDNNNVSDMQMHERLKVLRSQFDSRECVIIPGPHDTKMTDEEGLEEAVNGLQGEHENILLRDSKSTYMRGERRHPKWVLLRPSRDYNFIILDRRGTGPYTYQLGAGPILDGSVLGNRAVEYKGSDYMDVGTARNQQKAFKVGDIVRVSISGVTKKVRGGRNVYDIHVRQIEGDGEGEGAASAESLDLLTKSYGTTFVPFDIELTEGGINLLFNDMDSVTYQVEKFNHAWYVHSPKSTLGDLYKSDYPVQLAESIASYWSPFVPLMMENILVKMEGKVPNLEQQEEESAGLLEEDDEERLLKPRTKKALDVIARTLDVLAKERMTWTGPKGLGIDLATPIESPQGPTKVTDEQNLPDYDPKGVGRKTDEKKRTEHVVIPVDGEQPIVLDYENDQAKISPA